MIVKLINELSRRSKLYLFSALDQSDILLANLRYKTNAKALGIRNKLMVKEFNILLEILE